MTVLRIAVGPAHDVEDSSGPHWATAAVRAGGGRPVAVGEPADGIVWLAMHEPDGLRVALDKQPELRWVQLPSAGIEAVVGTGIITDERIWTCAKGSYARPVAEHALALALAGLRILPERATARTWGRSAGTSLYDQDVTILGGGGITEELLRLLAPFRVRTTVVRRTDAPLAGATRVLATDDLHRALPGALVVFLALALTPETVGIIGAPEIALLDARTHIVNVARGRHIDTEALADALATGSIAGAGLDVTDPEPLPDGHRLWAEPRCLITPHSADTWDMVKPLLAARIAANVAHLAADEPLEGLVDVSAGY